VPLHSIARYTSDRQGPQSDRSVAGVVPHLSNRVRPVSEPLHVLRHQRLSEVQAICFVVWDDLRLQAIADIVAPRVKGTSSRATAVHDIVVTQDLPSCRQPIDHRRLDVRASVACMAGDAANPGESAVDCTRARSARLLLLDKDSKSYPDHRNRGHPQLRIRWSIVLYTSQWWQSDRKPAVSTTLRRAHLVQ
jgi:hypothetical protein